MCTTSWKSSIARSHRRDLALLAVAGLAWLLVAIPHFPGAMTWDSLDQLRQARQGTYNDWQPPVMARLWRSLLWIQDGPGGLLLLHTAMLLGATALFFLESARNKRWLAFVFLLLPFLPWVINFEFVLWKDMGMAFSWLLAVAIGLFWRRDGPMPRPAAVAMAVLFAYGLLVRANALPAAVFLAIFLAGCFTPKLSRRAIAAVVIACVAAAVALPRIVNAWLSAERTHPISYVMFDDLAALALAGKQAGEPFFDPAELEQLRRCDLVKRTSVGAPFCLNGKFDDYRAPAKFPQLREAWLRNVLAAPAAYARYRLAAFLTLVRSPAREPFYPMEFRRRAAPYTFDSPLVSPGLGDGAAILYVAEARTAFPGLFKPYAWMALAGLLAWALHRTRQAPALWLLPVSAIAYLLGYLPTTPSGDLRYAYWSMLITTMSAMAWLVRVADPLASIWQGRQAAAQEL